MNNQELINELIAARDFCSEREVLREWEDEHGQLGPYALREVFAAVEAEWGKSQRATGVSKPISARERRQINRDLK
jgi:hypothetical protein